MAIHTLLYFLIYAANIVSEFFLSFNSDFVFDFDISPSVFPSRIFMFLCLAL